MIGQYILWTVVIALFLIGLTGTILPTLPGNLLIFGGALIYGIFTEFEEVTLWVLAALGVISIGAQVLDYLAEAYGARRFGATKYGIWGAIIGGGHRPHNPQYRWPRIGYILGGNYPGNHLGRPKRERGIEDWLGEPVGVLRWNPDEIHPGNGFDRDILCGPYLIFSLDTK